MKREEAVLIIAECLVEPHSPDPMIEAGIILKRIEKFMKPIGYNGVFATGKKYNPKTDSGRDTHYFSAWEPEDEA